MCKKLILLTSFLLVLGLVGSASAALPEGWQSQDIGTTDGSVAESDGTWAISADGADVWNSSDEFHYAYVPLSGDGTIVARVVDYGTGSNAWCKGGVMIRETLDADSKHAIMALTGGNGGGITFQGRPVTSERSNSMHDDITAAPPHWVKLTREGNTITAYHSADGVTWELMTDTATDGDITNPWDVEMAEDVYIGLFVTSHAAGEIRTYTFDNVSVIEPTGFNIIWVSGAYDDDVDGITDDIGWVELLEAQGHTVDYTMGASVGDGYWRTLDDDKIAALNAADLIIVSRCSNSGDYDDDDEVAQWNSITTPIMLQAMHIVRSSRWRWLDTTALVELAPMVEILAPDNPIFAGVTSPVQIMDETTGTANFPDVNGVGVGNGTLLAQVADTVEAWIAVWEPGVEFYAGSGEIAGGPRMIFPAGTPNVAGVTGRGMYNLTPEGETIFLNAVNHMLPAVDVTAPGDIVQGVPNDGLMDGDNFGWPGAETPDLAVDDDTSTKFLHFKGELEPTGFQVTPSAGPTIVTGLTLTTANDEPPRDPVTFELSGSNDSIDGPYTLIASGDIVDFAQADAWPRFTMNTTPISFDNDVVYSHYQVLFPAVRDAGSANSMQIAEVELLGITSSSPTVVDDFESYNDSDRIIFETWVDGRDDPSNGSFVGHENPPFAEQTIVHGGLQSMPFSYNNTSDVLYSETLRIFDDAQDWTQGGVDVLSLYLHGQPDNDLAPIYLRLKDNQGTDSVVYNPNLDALKTDGWTELMFPIIEFANMDVDLRNIKEVSIGIGLHPAGLTHFPSIELLQSDPACGYCSYNGRVIFDEATLQRIGAAMASLPFYNRCLLTGCVFDRLSTPITPIPGATVTLNPTLGFGQMAAVTCPVVGRYLMNPKIAWYNVTVKRTTTSPQINKGVLNTLIPGLNEVNFSLP